MHRSAMVKLVFLIACGVLVGCGGGSLRSNGDIASINNSVASIALSPAAFSLISGDVAQLTATPMNGAHMSVAANITYSSSNTAVVTVSNSGSICAGVWDSLTTPVNCNGLSGGNPVSGSATITVTAGGVSNTVPVIVHAKVTKVTVDPVAGCTSSSQTK